ncbi:MAG: polymer-forming cytoskeletal protein [Burkholderiaceae bacterium]|jgi:cytoskeletal protein CcmA (bactofilin family)
MTPLDLDLTPEPAPASPAVLAARHRRALVVGLGGGRDSDSPMAKSSFAERRLRATDTVSTRFVEPLPASAAPPMTAEIPTPTPRPKPASVSRLQLEDALVVPAGALIRGYVRCRALLLVGDIVGNVHCTGGPVVIRSGASLKGRLVATGDVYVCGTVGDTGGGAVITTRGKLTLAPGARVDGDVRSGWLDLYDGSTLQGAAKACED